MEWRNLRGSARTRCGPHILSCLGMKVRNPVANRTFGYKIVISVKNPEFIL